MPTTGTSSPAPPVELFVIFGRPGAGKTTVSEKAIEILTQEKDPFISCSCRCLDLDVCVPQWMRDNFAKGIYPTLAQRQEFALEACDYVDRELGQFISSCSKNENTMIISFSFVNTDLRDTFRSRFPQATWILIDTSDETSQERIQMRQGHFYKGAPPSSEIEETTPTDCKTGKEIKDYEKEDNGGDGSRKQDQDQTEAENSEWDFAPVSFEHVILDGLQPIEFNARRVIETMKGNL